MDEYGNCIILHPDLYIKDNTSDLGYTSVWDRWLTDPFGVLSSPDIWVENLDGTRPPIIESNTDYNIRVRIRNRGHAPSTGNEKIYLNWNRAALATNWRSGWEQNYVLCATAGSNVLVGNNINSSGNPIGAVIPYGNSYVYRHLWTSPDEIPFMLCSRFNKFLHFYSNVEIADSYGFLARIHDGQNIPNETSINVPLEQFVKHSNNVAVNKKAVVAGKWGRVIFIDPNIVIARPFDLRIELASKADGTKLNKFAELYIYPDEEMFERWKKDGAKGEGFKLLDGAILVSSDGAVLRNLTVNPDSITGFGVTVNFFSKETPESSEFDFNIYQIVGKDTIDAVPFTAVRDLNRYFAIQAHAEAVLTEKSLKLTADPLGEPAKYIWYNAAGKDIGSDREIEIELPKTSQWYKLEVIADADHYKDYDSVFVNIPAGFISSISPNPTQSEVTVEYFLSDIAQSASLFVYNSLGNLVASEPLDIHQKEKTLYLSGLLQGNYSIVLVINNIPSDSKILIKQ